MNKLKQFGIYILIAPIILLWIGFGIGTTSFCPDNTLLLVNEDKKEYYAPPCIMTEGFDDADKIKMFAMLTNLKVLTDKELKGKALKPNTDCRDKEGFIEDGRSLSGGLLEKIGLLPKFQSRWNDDGTWNK
ncbi:MAG: hypothetical protein J0L66_10695 [Cytophagales bacterium]|nr:hypothetical protein [Cytophagales bacterium]